MHPRIILIAALTAVTGLTACDKDKEAGCEQLAASVRDNDDAAARTVMSSLLLHLSRRKHTSDNLQALVDKINSECKVSASVGCFQCIKTLPAMSEVNLTVGGITRTVDISSNQAGDMVYSHLH